MNVENLELDSSFLNTENLVDWSKNKKFVRTYVEILQSEVDRAKPLLKGHTDEVKGLALSSDNSFLISCGKDKTLIFWNLIFRKLEKSEKIEVEENESITSMTLSPDNKFIIFVISEKSLIIQHLNSPKSPLKVPGSKDVTIKSVSIGNDSLVYCTADSEKRVMIYDLNNEVQKNRTFEVAELTFVLFNKQVLLVGCSVEVKKEQKKDGKIQAWDTLSNEIIYILEGTSSCPETGVLYEENSLLIVGYSGGEVIIWNLLSESQEVSINTERDSPLTKISYSSSLSKELIVASNQKNELIFINATKKKVKRCISGRSSNINSILQTKNGKLVITNSDVSIKIWQKGQFRDSKPLMNFGKDIKCTSLHSGSNTLAIAYQDDSIKIFNLSENQEKLSFSWKSQKVLTAIWSNDKKQLITSNSTPEISVYSYEKKNVEFTIPCNAEMTFLVLSADSKLLYGCSGSTKINCWDFIEKTSHHVFEAKDSSAHYYVVTFSPDWSKMYSGGDDVIDVWDLTSKQIMTSLQAGKSSIKCLLMLSKGKTLISGGNVTFWDLKLNKPEFPFNDINDEAQAMELFKEEKFLVIAFNSPKVRVFNIENKTLDNDFQVGAQICCKVLNNSILIIADSANIRFYNLDTKQEEAVIKAHHDLINSLLIHEESDTLLSFSSDRWIKSWKISDKSQNESYQTYCGNISALSLNSTHLGIATEEGTVFIYSVNTTKEIKYLEVHTMGIRSLDCSKKYFATGSFDTKVGLIDLQDYKTKLLEGHKGCVFCVRFSKDSRHVFSASDDNMIRAWNVENKDVEYFLEGHNSGVYSLCVFPSGKFLVSGSTGKEIKVWNLATRKEQYSLENQSYCIFSLCVSGNESVLFTGSYGGEIAAFDLKIQKKICKLTKLSSPIKDLVIYNNLLYSTSSEEIKTWPFIEKKETFSFSWSYETPFRLALSPDEKYLAVGFYEGAIRIYDFNKEKFLDTFHPFVEGIPKLAFTEDSKSLLLATKGSNMLIWNIEKKTGQEIPDTKEIGRIIKFSNDFRYLASFSDDFKAYVWDWKEQKILYTLEGHGSDSYAMAFSTDEETKFLFVGTHDGSVFKWNLSNKEKYQFRVHKDVVRVIVFSLSRNLLVSGSHDSTICFYNLENNETDIKEKVHKYWIRVLAITPNDKYLISGGDDEALKIWDLDTREFSSKLTRHSSRIYGIAVSLDSNKIYSCSEDKSIICWYLTESKEEKYLRTASGNIYCIVLTNDGKTAYTGSDENTINIFNLLTQTEVACLSEHKNTVCDLALSLDETILVSGSWDKSIRVFEIKSYAVIAKFEDAHEDYVRSVAITKDNETIISCSDDRFIFIWNIKEKRKLFALEGHRDYILNVCLTDDEKFLISTSRDGMLKLWRMDNKTEAHNLICHKEAANCLTTFKENGKFITGGEDKLIKVWSMIRSRNDEYIIVEVREEYSLKGHSDAITAIKLTSDNLRLISGSKDARINIWDLVERVIKYSISGNTQMILALNITKCGKLITAENNRSLKVFKMSENDSIKSQDQSNKFNVSLQTPDEKFKLIYLYGSFQYEVQKNLNSQILEMGTTKVFDPYYQNLLRFYNLIDSIQEDDYSNLLNTSSNVVFSQFLYTTLHILASTGNSKVLKNMNSPNIQIKSDYFGKSPLYYALVQQKQDCVDHLINLLISVSEQDDTSRVQSSYSAISKDLHLIIKNSSKSLHILLRNCLISTELDFAKIQNELPFYKFTLNCNPITKDFVDDEKSNVENVPVIMKYTPFTLPSKMGSKDCIELLKAIIECSNNDIYNTHLIQYLLQIQWENLIHWVFGYTFLLWFNLLILVLLFTENNNITESWKLPIFLFINFLLILWETIQMFIHGIFGYFKEPWNLVDTFRFWLSMLWILMKILDENGLEFRILAWLVALLNFTRGLTGFRLFNGTRYYVRLILRAMKDMGYFIIMLSYSTFTFGVMFQVSRNDDAFEFKSLWMDSYSLNFGNFDAHENYSFSYETMAYMLATVINVILMLNLLISILGDSYEKFQEEKLVIDYKEKASVILEIQQMFFWVGEKTENRYLHLMFFYADINEKDTIEEKVDKVANRLTKMTDEFTSNTKTSKELADQIQKLDSEVKEKFNGVQNKIGGIEGKFNVVENKIGGIEGKFNVVENKIGGIEGKFNDLSQTLNQILDILKPKQEEKKQ